ncbi:MAG: copper resistance protein CopC [Actinomycetota bacterium]|nr:copper resistance protein CopC [Actinomycetota bacterium]
MRRRVLPLAGAIMILVQATSPAGAWPFVPVFVESTPLDEERLQSAPAEVALEFSHEIDAAASTIEVRNECGKRVDKEEVKVTGTTLSTEVESAFKGTYTVAYEATGFGSFSGTATGEVSFDVHLGSSCGSVRGSRHHPGGSSNPSGNSDNRSDAERHSGHSQPSGTGTDHTSTADQSGARPMTSNHSSHSSSDTFDSTDPFGNGSANRPPLAAPTPLVTPTPLPTLTPAPTPTAEPDQELTLAASPQPPPPADGADVLIALSLVVSLGVLGGWVLRASAPR